MAVFEFCWQLSKLSMLADAGSVLKAELSVSAPDINLNAS
jgi:hypothetical protein